MGLSGSLARPPCRRVARAGVRLCLGDLRKRLFVGILFIVTRILLASARFLPDIVVTVWNCSFLRHEICVGGVWRVQDYA